MEETNDDSIFDLDVFAITAWIRHPLRKSHQETHDNQHRCIDVEVVEVLLDELFEQESDDADRDGTDDNRIEQSRLG